MPACPPVCACASAACPQVRLKAQALAGFMAAQHGAQRTYALLTLANKLISQCEVQVGGEVHSLPPVLAGGSAG